MVYQLYAFRIPGSQVLISSTAKCSWFLNPPRYHLLGLKYLHQRHNLLDFWIPTNAIFLYSMPFLVSDFWSPIDILITTCPTMAPYSLPYLIWSPPLCNTSIPPHTPGWARPLERKYVEFCQGECSTSSLLPSPNCVVRWRAVHIFGQAGPTKVGSSTRLVQRLPHVVQ